MCWSAKVSLNTFIYGFISAIIVYALNVIPLHVIIIFLSFTSMQLLEYFAWTYLNNKKINKILSYIGLLLIIIQIFLINYLSPNKQNSKILLRALFIILVFFMIFQFKNITFKMTVGKNGHLLWHWLDLPILWIIIGLMFYVIPTYLTKSKTYLPLYFMLITIIISFYYYYKYKTWGTMWCYISNIAWIFLILISILSKFNINI